MKLYRQYLLSIWLVCMVLISAPSQAHLMVAQHGSLNLVDGGAFMVLSLPVTAFEGVDDNMDDQLSMVEFNLNRSAIIEQITHRVSLSNRTNTLSLEGLILSPVMAHHSKDQEITQITVLGKFVLEKGQNQLTFSSTLFGKSAAEQALNMTVTRPADDWQYDFVLTPASPTKRWGEAE